MRAVGLDVGGANLKASDGETLSLSRPLPLWRELPQLPSVLKDLLARFAPFDLVAVSMTAELADCFETKAQGVARVLDCVRQSAGDVPIAVWQTGGEFISIEQARELTPLVAAANWHALATWAARALTQETGLLIDVGSTTTDIIPLEEGVAMPQGRTDLERLLSGELVYSGVRRTPLCALASDVPLGNRRCPMAAEVFATTVDLYLLTGDLPPEPNRNDTADGRPCTADAAHNRVAHMLCCDQEELTREATLTMAEDLVYRQSILIADSIRRVLDRMEEVCSSILLSGEGEFLARLAVQEAMPDDIPQLLSIGEALGPQHARAASAYALARLASERLRLEVRSPKPDILN